MFYSYTFVESNYECEIFIWFFTAFIEPKRRQSKDNQTNQGKLEILSE